MITLNNELKRVDYNGIDFQKNLKKRIPLYLVQGDEDLIRITKLAQEIGIRGATVYVHAKYFFNKYNIASTIKLAASLMIEICNNFKLSKEKKEQIEKWIFEIQEGLDWLSYGGTAEKTGLINLNLEYVEKWNLMKFLLHILMEEYIEGNYSTTEAVALIPVGKVFNEIIGLDKRKYTKK